MRYFVIGDIHGFYDEMIAALNKAGFDSEDENHTLISLGDNFDRGPKPREVMKFLWKLPRKILIRGNHEDLLLECLRFRTYASHDVSNGTFKTIADFANMTPTMAGYLFDQACEETEHSGVRFFINELMVNYFEVGNYIFVHGWIPLKDEGYHPPYHIKNRNFSYNPNWREDASEIDWENARWNYSVDSYEKGLIEPGKIIVCGHWNTLEYHLKFNRKMSNEIFYGNGVIAIDGSTAGTGLVNVLVIED